MSPVTGDAETAYVPGAAEPWIPFKPLCEEVLLRYHRIDPIQGQIVVTVRLPPDRGLAPLYHTGPVLAHTIRGAWRYREQDWIARAGDTVCDAAGSTHTAECVGDEEVVVFMVIMGEFLFFDDDGALVWQESWRTSMERHAEHCMGAD